MIVAGCDVGSLATKAVVLNEKTVLAQAVVPSSFDTTQSAHEAMGRALELAGLNMSDIAFCVGTGYGRDRIPFVSKSVSEIACHAKGAHWLLPSARTVIDIGGQDCKAIRLDGKGNVLKFLTNDKCAAGTGRFLEVMVGILGLGLEELGNQRGKAGEAIQLASTCTVWAQAEVIHHLNAKKDIAQIAHAVNRAMAGRVAILARGVGIERDLVMTGGVAKNRGVTSTLEELLGTGIRRLRLDPQVIGALGAAVIAKEQLEAGAA
jgi:predicted CoA-substrate-specific enzyme activase